MNNLNSIKLIALDLDETLLTTDKKISSQNHEIIKKARAAEIHIVFASGRHFDGVKTITNIIGNTDYCISSVGAVVTDKNNRLVHSTCLDGNTVHEFLTFLKSENIYAQVYPPLKPFLFETRCILTDKYENVCKCKGEECPDMYSRTDLLSTKILMADDPDVLLQLRPKLMKKFPDYPYLLSQPDHLEIISPLASKGEALKYICSMLNIKREETLAVGDNEVDLEMLKYAGHSACPQNAIEEIKNVADYISPKTNNENAVTDILNHYIFGE